MNTAYMMDPSSSVGLLARVKRTWTPVICVPERPFTSRLLQSRMGFLQPNQCIVKSLHVIVGQIVVTTRSILEQPVSQFGCKKGLNGKKSMDPQVLERNKSQAPDTLRRSNGLAYSSEGVYIS